MRALPCEEKRERLGTGHGITKKGKESFLGANGEMFSERPWWKREGLRERGVDKKKTFFCEGKAPDGPVGAMEERGGKKGIEHGVRSAEG